MLLESRAASSCMLQPSVHGLGSGQWCHEELDQMAEPLRPRFHYVQTSEIQSGFIELLTTAQFSASTAHTPDSDGWGREEHQRAQNRGNRLVHHKAREYTSRNQSAKCAEGTTQGKCARRHPGRRGLDPRLREYLGWPLGRAVKTRGRREKIRINPDCSLWKKIRPKSG